MKRLLTAALGVPLALWALFRLPPTAFFVLVAVLFCLAAWEYSRIASHWAPEAPLGVVVLLVPVVAWILAPQFAPQRAESAVALLVLVLSAGVGLLVLLWRTPVEQGLPAMGAVAFGSLYLGLPVAALAELQRRAPWLVFLLWAIVWLGDSAAYYVGTAFGRRRLAPLVSPKKSWEGASAAFVTSGLAAAVFGVWKGGAVDATLVGLALLTSVVAQAGDLVESVIKRGAGVKDSGTLLPGHGGFLDRFDALIFAAPVWWFVLLSTGRLP